jgi:Flp pilus assembly protein TadG
MGNTMSFTRSFARNQAGAVLVETTVLIPILLVFLFGAVDFSLAFYEWSLATKAVQVGARIAAVSDPVASGLNSISTGVLSGTVVAGDPMPSFQVTCEGATPSCTCTIGTCPGMGTFSWAAMNKIVCGRDNTSSTECTYNLVEPKQCRNATSLYFSGMCDIFPRITAANVRVVYTQTGLGFAGRFGGPVPTITVSLQNLPFQFFFLNGLLGFQPINISQATTTTTGEILSSAAQ